MTTAAVVAALKDADQDFEWYPTTTAMIDAIRHDLFGELDEYRIRHYTSMLDIGAGDGRVLMGLAGEHDHIKLMSIEKSPILQQRQSDRIIPVGTEFIEQNLMSLPVDVTFSNPPYSVFEEWAEHIIRTAYTKRLYLILPERWEQSDAIKGAAKSRNALTSVIYRGDFYDADRAARARVHIVRVLFQGHDERYYHRGYPSSQDPFNVWFDQNIDTFDREAELDDKKYETQALARLSRMDSIPAMVEAFNEDYARMEDNYRAIFKLDATIFRELGVSKDKLREGLKERIQTLKHTYWHELFNRLDAITSRLSTKTKRGFLERLTGQTAIAFTEQNAYAVVLWAIKAANQYFDAQIVDLFKSLATREGSENYKSNTRTWVRDGWRYNADNDKFSHFKLDYRIVLDHYRAMFPGGFGEYEYPGGLHTTCHEIIDDMIAVFTNLGFRVQDVPSRSRVWRGGQWQDFCTVNGDTVFQVKGYKNGNLHLRMDPNAIKALNIEAGRLLGWVKSPADVVSEMGYTAEDAQQYFGSHQRLGTGSVRLLHAGA